MKKLKFEIEINATCEYIWDKVVNVENYKLWAEVFHPGSFFEGSWNKGDTIRFIIINESGKKEGMVSEIAESVYPYFISIRHLGYIYNGIDDTTSEDILKWAPAYENYTMESKSNLTHFTVDMDVEDDYFDMFSDLWPKALLKLKEISEE